jgi:hypothetical protein
MKNFRLNRKGQFSVIAAMLVAVVLVSAVMTTYSSIRYNSQTETPQTLSTIDEVNLALKRILGFTVGYYGSVLEVTGNTSYAKALASNYLSSGLDNIADIRPDLSPSFRIVNLDLSTKWYSNQSYSAGNFLIKYDLGGLGVTGLTYSASSRLDVQVLNTADSTHAMVNISSDGEPLINLGQSSFKFYKYLYSNSTWNFIGLQTEPVAYMDGRYLLTLPPGINSTSFVLKIEDSRGLMVVASSFSKFTGSLTWNATSVETGFNYVGGAASNVDSSPSIGSHSNFTAQQVYPDSVYDSLTEGTSGTGTLTTYPTNWTPLGTTTCSSGTIADLQTDDTNYMTLRSYPVISSYNTIGHDSSNSAIRTSSGSSLTWTHNTGSGSNRILIVSVDTYSTSGSPATVNSVTYGSSTMTQLATGSYTSGSTRVRSYVYYLLNPSTGSATVTVNFASSTSSAVGGSTGYYNVDQNAPAYSTPTSASTSGTVYSNSITASGSQSKFLFGHIATYRSSSYTVIDGQTNTRWSQTGQYYRGYGSDKSVTSGSVTCSWTLSNTASYVAIAVLLQPTVVISSYNAEAEFTGPSVVGNSWNSLLWRIISCASINNVNVNYTLYNYRTSQYVSTGSGFMSDVLLTSERTQSQLITTGLADFNDSSGNWKIKVSATASSQFDLKLDLMQYTHEYNNYVLDLEEQWINVNASNVRQDLCIKTGSFGSESLIVQVRSGNSWVNLMTLNPNVFNNVSLSPYINSATLTIRFIDGSATGDYSQNSWLIDSVFIKPQADISYLANLQDSTFTVELLQNGTIRWLGQNLALSNQELPIPPVPVKSIHVNETINGVSQEVPFQIEDWGSDYQVPLGLTNNATLFGNRQMLVFLMNNKVTDFTIWWDGSDTAVQTSLAYTNKYFTNDNPGGGTLRNGILTLSIDSGTFTVTSTAGSMTSTTNFMRINGQGSTYGAGQAYVIHHGVVRDIVQQEAEWGNGAPNSPNLYASIVITMSANCSYYSYQLRLMFINSTQARTLTDLCPIRMTASSSYTLQTENGTNQHFPIVQNGTGTFYNYASGGNWTEHHWSQLISSDGTKGAGIMFTDKGNRQLYAHDSMAGTATGDFNVNQSSGLIEMSPVDLASASFQYPLDITWSGAVVTVDGTTPICKMYDATTPTGLWILVEFPPTLTVTASS